MPFTIIPGVIVTVLSPSAITGNFAGSSKTPIKLPLTFTHTSVMPIAFSCFNEQSFISR